MVVQTRNIISQSERNYILELYNRPENYNSFAIVEWLSPDEKYCIFLDELYDIENKTKLGDIWENFDRFKFFLTHCFETAKHLKDEIKHQLLESVNSLVITESNQDMRGLKPYIKELIKEWTANPFDKEFYSGKNWSDAYDAAKNTVSSAWEGLKKTYSYIKDGQWKEAFNIIGKGMLWVARKIRSALYNPIGMILDAILIATGIGKSLQFVIWAVVVLLDIYELMTGDFEEKDMSLGWRLMFLGVDILGMVTAGAAAKAAKVGIFKLMNKFGKSAKGLETAAKESPLIKSTAESILKSSSSASGYIQKAATHLQKNAPTVYKFVSTPLKGFGKFFGMLMKTLKGILGIGGKILNAPAKTIEKIAGASMKDTKLVKGLGGAANTMVPLIGAHAYGSYRMNKEMARIEDALQNSETVPDYDESQI